MQDKLLALLMQKDELTWKDIIYDLIKTEKMDPWDIDISELVSKYLETIKKLQEHNFFISGKIILASSILLRIKSHKLMEEYLPNFDSLLFPQEEELIEAQEEQVYRDYPELLIKTPQSRKRKVNIDNLMHALTKALDVEKRREIKRLDERPIREIQLPKDTKNITTLIKELYSKIKTYFQKQETITFTQLIPSTRKQDKVSTFIPLLHLANHQKVDIDQYESFGEIYIKKFKELQLSQQKPESAQKTP